MVNIGGDLEGLPPGAEVIEAPRVQRQVEYSNCSGVCTYVQPLIYSIHPQVLLRTGPDGSPLVYACSWWNAEIVSLGAACMETLAG